MPGLVITHQPSLIFWIIRKNGKTKSVQLWKRTVSTPSLKKGAFTIKR